MRWSSVMGCGALRRSGGRCGSILRDSAHQGIGKMGLGGARLLQALTQVGAEAAQLFDARDDAVLLGDPW